MNPSWPCVVVQQAVPSLMKSRMVLAVSHALSWINLVEIDMGIALVPQMVAATKLQEGTIVKIDTDIQVPERTIVLVQSRMVPQTEGMRQFVDLLLGRETIDRKEDIQ